MPSAVFSMPLKSAKQLRQTRRRAFWAGLGVGLLSQGLYWGTVYASGALSRGNADPMMELLSVWAVLFFGAWTVFGYGQAGGSDAGFLAGRAELEMADLLQANLGIRGYCQQVVASGRPFTQEEYLAMRRWAERQQLYGDAHPPTASRGAAFQGNTTVEVPDA